MPILSNDLSLHKERAYWSGVYAMTLCVFALIASEFMPVSLLTPISGDLGVSEGLVGQGIAISGVFAVLTSLSISTLAGGLNRKTLLLSMTALMAFSGAIIALAPSYLIYMVGRAPDWYCYWWVLVLISRYCSSPGSATPGSKCAGHF